MEKQRQPVVLHDYHSTSFSPTLCVTHKCNLNCTYCYQKNKDHSSMSFETAKECIDDIFHIVPENTKIIEISFIGGEPLEEVELIKKIYDYTLQNHNDSRLSFFATTNGTILSNNDKEWFTRHKDRFVLGLSLDGTPRTHNINRSNSYSLIDVPFFLRTWPKQGPKMTISKASIGTLAKDIIFLENLGFSNINGVNFAEGDFEWESDETLQILSKQLKILLDYYTTNYNASLDQMFGKHIEYCSSNNVERSKTCGIGTRTILYDTDGKKYPCTFVTPLTFSEQELGEILKQNFEDSKNFIDEDCATNCYIYPVCGSCSGANYLVNHAFNKRLKTRCKMNKLICLYIAELHTRRILNHRELYNDDDQLYFLIEAIKEIKKRYYAEFKKLLSE